MRSERNVNGFAKSQEAAQPDKAPFSDGSGFTPAPWRVAGKGTIRTETAWVASINWRNREANARLIAAAPQLYEALSAAMAFINSHVADPDITQEMADNYAILMGAQPMEVLAIASGSTPSPRSAGRG